MKKIIALSSSLIIFACTYARVDNNPLRQMGYRPHRIQKLHAVKSQGTNILSWSTEGEAVSGNFIIEESSDNKHWIRIGALPCADEKNVPNIYYFGDLHPKGHKFYRLLQW